MKNYILLKILKKDIVVILKNLIRQQNELKAVFQLLRLLDLHSYLSELLKSLHFEHQLKLYVKTYLSDCFFEINTTTCYSNTSQVCITAHKSIIKDIIKNLCEILTFLTKKKKQ